MKWHLLGAALLGMIICSLGYAHSAQAIESLKIQPLLYEEQLQKGEVKKGFIDVSNPTGQTVTVTTSVEGFRQVNNGGQLEFFTSEALEKGITPDYKSFKLAPREALRMVFQIDGNKLPSGDIFGALFFTTKPTDKGTTKQSVRVGTLFILENGTPGSRKADITAMQTDFLHIGSQIDGSYTIKNTAREGEATGFTPLVNLKLSPFGSTQQNDSSLVFAGRERTNTFAYQTNLPGLYRLSAQYDDSTQARWVLVLPLWSLWVLGALILAAAVAFSLWRRRQPRVHLGKKPQ